MPRRLLLSVLALLTLLGGSAPAWAAPFSSDRISVRTVGKGRDVVLIPGLTSSPDAWRDVVPLLPGYRFHLVQVKGFAGTPVAGNAAGPVLPAVADEIARYLKESRVKAAVAGHSMGGSTAMLLTERHPEVVERLMVVDMPAFMAAMVAGPQITPEQAATMAAVFSQGMTAGTEEAYQQRLAAQFGTMARNKAMLATALDQAKRSDRRLVATVMGELVALDLRPGLAKVGVPTTVLYVTPAGVPLSDAQVDEAYRRQFAGLKGAKLVRVPDAAHFIMSDNPQAFAAAFKAWME